MMFEAKAFHEVATDVITASKAHEVRQKDDIFVDWEGYLQESLQGTCITFTMRDDAGKLIAYNMFLITSDPHRKNRIEAQNQMIWVAPEHRGKASVRFMRDCHEWLKNKQINNVVYVMSDERIGKLLEKSGFKPTHTVWSLNNE